MNFDNLTIEEICEFLKTWGLGFKNLDKVQFPNAEGYYDAMVDTYLFLNNKPLIFFNLRGLKFALRTIAKEFMIEFTSKRQDKSYKERAELLEYIIEKLLINRENVVQATILS